jgi:hypothetical protein
MTERRYSEDEVAAIFRQAAEAQQTARRQLTPGEGMTLAELEAIGKEVGLPPQLVAQAASALDVRGQVTSRRFLGLPVGVGRTVPLGRFLTEEEWERLVVDLRETFDARGTIRHEGSFRQWTNGNLQVLLEPTETGHQLRLRTVKGDSRRLMTIGLAFVTLAGVTLLAKWATGGLADVVSGMVMLGAMGLVSFGIGALRLPGWARLRARQMEGVAARLALEPKPTGALPGETT